MMNKPTDQCRNTPRNACPGCKLFVELQDERDELVEANKRLEDQLADKDRGHEVARSFRPIASALLALVPAHRHDDRLGFARLGRAGQVGRLGALQ